MAATLITFFTGLTVGSFLNVVIIRGARSEGLGGRSRCNGCRVELSWQELIPLLSFLVQKRRCRHCGAVLSWQYPVVELGTALVYGWAAWLVFSQSQYGLWFEAWVLVVLLAALAAAIVIFVVDYLRQIIPHGPVLVLMAAGLIFTALRGIDNGNSVIILNQERLLYDVGAAFLWALFFFSLWLVSRGRWIGLGDAKLIFATSLLVGFPTSLVSFLFAYWLGALGGITMLALGKKGWKELLPFGPYILAGTALAYFFSEKFLILTGISEFI